MFRHLCFLVIGICAVASVSSARAQSWKHAGSKAAGYYSEYHGHSSHSHLYGAQSHAKHYSNYLSTTTTVDPSVARIAHDSIGNHLNKTQQHLSQMKAQLSAHENKEGVESISEIEGHLQDARLHHADLNKITIQKPIDSKAAKATVNSLQSSINKAIAAHASLLESLGIKEPTHDEKESK